MIESRMPAAACSFETELELPSTSDLSDGERLFGGRAGS